MTQERVLIDDSIFNLKVVLFNFVADFLFDCEQSIFSSKICGEECRKRKCASVTMSMTCKWGATMPQAKSSVGTETQAKRDCNGSMQQFGCPVLWLWSNSIGWAMKL